MKYIKVWFLQKPDFTISNIFSLSFFFRRLGFSEPHLTGTAIIFKGQQGAKRWASSLRSYVLHREVITVADLSDNPTPRPWAELTKCREIEYETQRCWTCRAKRLSAATSFTSCFFVGLCVFGSKENSCSLLLEGPGDTLSNKQRKGMVWNG